jgi:hypothetical protein
MNNEEIEKLIDETIEMCKIKPKRDILTIYFLFLIVCIIVGLIILSMVCK